MKRSPISFKPRRVLLALTAARNPAGATCISPSGRDTSSVNDRCSKLATMSSSSNQNDVRAKYWTLLSEHARNKIASTGKSERRALLELLLEVIAAIASKDCLQAAGCPLHVANVARSHVK